MDDRKTVLVIAAHPDDEILGCGGTMARLVNEGHHAVTAILGEGKTSRDPEPDRSGRADELGSLQEEMRRANEKIGVQEVVGFDLPDNRFDTIALLDVVKIVEDLKARYRPAVIFTHSEHDLNIDHQVLFRAVLTATRPQPGEVVREVYSFEVQSSTEWRFPLSFSPDVFYDIKDTLETKIAAMDCYRSELRDFPHPRSLEAIRLNAQMWGTRSGMTHAEAFKTIRCMR